MRRTKYKSMSEIPMHEMRDDLAGFLHDIELTHSVALYYGENKVCDHNGRTARQRLEFCRICVNAINHEIERRHRVHLMELEVGTI